MDPYEAVLDYFRKVDQPVSAGQVAEATGIDRKEVDKVMAKLKKKKNSFAQAMLLEIKQ